MAAPRKKTTSMTAKNIESRVDRLEVTVDNLAHAVETYMKANSEEMKQVTSHLERIARPQWSQLGLYLTIILMIGGFLTTLGTVILTGQSGRIDMHDIRIERLDEELEDAKYQLASLEKYTEMHRHENCEHSVEKPLD